MSKPKVAGERRPRLSRKAAQVVYIVVGIVGVLLVAFDVALILLEPSNLGPYFTAFAGVCLSIVGFVSYFMMRAAMRVAEASAPRGDSA